ncbi:hypothetical protein [Streptomyces asoensis]|uniref:hypothetical protein n=1 Tax=Streptomyces asoensis TaxID=249586 RepID=UPI0033C510E5
MGDTEHPAPVSDLRAEVVPMGVRLTSNLPIDDDIIGSYVWQGTTDPETGETVRQRNCGSDGSGRPEARPRWSAWRGGSEKVMARASVGPVGRGDAVRGRSLT